MTPFERNNRIAWGESARTWAEHLDEIQTRLEPFVKRLAVSRSLLVVRDAAESLAAIVFGLANNLDFGVIQESRLTQEVIARLDEHGLCRMRISERVLEGPEGGTIVPGRVTVLTSGTTGLLKLIPHTWSTLNTFDRVSKLPPNTWFVPYQIGSYAWYQMITLGLFKAGQHLIIANFEDLARSFASALTRGVTAISSTPTFWRYVIMNLDTEQLKVSNLSAISLGGEIVDQAIIDTLKGIYPEARIRHIFAASEVGAAIVVNDGKAGFPRSLLEAREGATVSVKVENGLLYIRSPYSTLQAETGRLDWVQTGDMVEERGDRVFITGRACNTMINVGGMKAFPSDIEAYLMIHPDVLWAQVYAQRAPLVGNLPAARIVLRRTLPENEAELMLSRYCREGLAEHAVPRLWEFLEAIPMRESLKS
jgi:acyl-coenzyme A synthetase/AMP-(fatty) acid ligase